MDLINGGGIDPLSGADYDPFTGQPVYGNDKGLGVSDILRFSNADLYYGAHSSVHQAQM